MYSNGHLCDALNTVAPEPQWNLQKSLPTLKQETVEYIDEQECSYNGSKYHEPLDSSEYVNQYDSKDWVLEQMKEESSELESLQSGGDMKSEITFQEKESLKLINKQETDSMKREEESFNVKVENKDEEYPFAKEMERLEEQRILDNVDETSIHYDILLSPQEVKCKLCGRIFKNNYNLLKHNNEHIKVEINPPGEKDMSEIHQYRYCDKGFNKQDNMLAHVSVVHSEATFCCEICGKQFRKIKSLRQHNDILHAIKMRSKNVRLKHCYGDFKGKNNMSVHIKTCRTGRKYKCDSCEAVFRSTLLLTLHIKRMHYDYGRLFDCWCGEQFRTPIHLSNHKYTKHGGGIETNWKYQCDMCKKVFKRKQNLSCHIKRLHYNYCGTFDCWCGKQFRTPMCLSNHKYTKHGGGIKTDGKYQCDMCKKIFKRKQNLSCHIKRLHHDYCGTFDCWCGEQFRSPIHLSYHRCTKHGGGMESDEKYQCDLCKKVFKCKRYLINHIKRLHFDYGRKFDCWCGKQFRSPIHLGYHRCTKHGGGVVSDGKYQCDICKKIFKCKRYLINHIKRLHFDYGRKFDCWCGKQFRSPIHLSYHQCTKHGGGEESAGKYQCDICKKVFECKRYLIDHIKRLHFDYGRKFDCWCGKQFRTPAHLKVHKRDHHGCKTNNEND